MPELCLFVYGTLRPGEGNHWRLAPHAARTEAAQMDGVAMFDLGVDPWPYAAASPDARISGDVVWISDDVDAHTLLSELDTYEVCDLEDPANSLYTRVTRPARLVASGELVEAWIYLAQGDTLQSLTEEFRVPSGDWRDAASRPAPDGN